MGDEPQLRYTHKMFAVQIYESADPIRTLPRFEKFGYFPFCISARAHLELAGFCHL